ncbi:MULTISPECIES: hypothetical protein [Streptomyces]|uniref:Uncharacterized protein n=1 Tax=Streptomyces chartreusis NRRL 3882 TaxID=1079985 RepID=A0A2N9BLW2_STRCX|nr:MULTISPECIES: hypothetical protein [Streptomyces]MYS92923.1 hypothetical protein [Streptomyces sp. SID5464]SOR84356.1 hypothetical protein SCNRRL3882_7801 [Streptomyces chartreusis NRRL 3882]
MKRSASSTKWKQNSKPAAALVALGGFLALSLWLGDEVWDLAAYWPGSGIGFGATVGVLLPITFTAAQRSFRRVSSNGSEYSPRWIVAGVVYAAVALVSALAASRAIPGKGSSGPCRSEWQPCWVNHLYPGAFLVTLGSLVATVGFIHWMPSWMSQLRVLSRR